jgi:hypothetical protein
MPSWLNKIFDGGKRVLGKVRGGLEAGLRLFNKARSGYGNVKQMAGNLPIVGQVAAGLIGEGERRAMEFASQKSGGYITPQNVELAAGISRRVARNLPREM